MTPDQIKALIAKALEKTSIGLTELEDLFEKYISNEDKGEGLQEHVQAGVDALSDLAQDLDELEDKDFTPPKDPPEEEDDDDETEEDDDEDDEEDEKGHAA